MFTYCVGCNDDFQFIDEKVRGISKPISPKVSIHRAHLELNPKLIGKPSP